MTQLYFDILKYVNTNTVDTIDTNNKSKIYLFTEQSYQYVDGDKYFPKQARRIAIYLSDMKPVYTKMENKVMPYNGFNIIKLQEDVYAIHSFKKNKILTIEPNSWLIYIPDDKIEEIVYVYRKDWDKNYIQIGLDKTNDLNTQEFSQAPYSGTQTFLIEPTTYFNNMEIVIKDQYIKYALPPILTYHKIPGLIEPSETDSNYLI